MRVAHSVFLDSISSLPFAFVLKVDTSWYLHYFNTPTNLVYVVKITDILYYGLDEMSASERNKFLAWYEGHKFEAFGNKRVLESYFLG